MQLEKPRTYAEFGIMGVQPNEWPGAASTAPTVAKHRGRMSGMGTVRIPLSKGKFALIDEEDLPLVSRHSWYANQTSAGIWYAFAGYQDEYGRTRQLALHRFLLDPPSALEVDHINGDGLDNRRANLRVATRQQNNYNQRIGKANSSGFKGVSFCKQTGRWKAQINFEGRNINLGRFDLPEIAAREYDRAARLIHKEFACLNFPKPGERSAL